jgi:tetratricopeptide (TPR) repeat protein
MRLLPLAATLVLPTLASAQAAPLKWADTIGVAIEDANITGDLAAIQAARAMADRVSSAFPQDGLILHYQGYALYSEANLLLHQKRDGWAVLARALDALERSSTLHPIPETFALMSTIDGQLIGRDPSRAMELGMASQTAMGDALKLGPKNPRVWLLRGMSTLFTPPEDGAGAEAARDQLLRALDLFNGDAPLPSQPAWGRAEAHLWLGQVYAKLGDGAKAAAEYKAALALAPDFADAKALASAVKP